ncbi:hypothetical protein [Methylobacterium sp. SI9]|uniref:hypothetical protein n=1 Tax=Methylobacterium guangdongense TaxID=3138811 RepID=UPI00313C0202
MRRDDADFCPDSALVHRLSPGKIDRRSATPCTVRVSGALPLMECAQAQARFARHRPDGRPSSLWLTEQRRKPVCFNPNVFSPIESLGQRNELIVP